MKISDKRKLAIYDAVTNPLMELRISVRRVGFYLPAASQERLDQMIYEAQKKAASDAVKAAEGKQ